MTQFPLGTFSKQILFLNFHDFFDERFFADSFWLVFSVNFRKAENLYEAFSLTKRSTSIAFLSVTFFVNTRSTLFFNQKTWNILSHNFNNNCNFWTWFADFEGVKMKPTFHSYDFDKFLALKLRFRTFLQQFYFKTVFSAICVWLAFLYEAATVCMNWVGGIFRRSNNFNPVFRKNRF